MRNPSDYFSYDRALRWLVRGALALVGLSLLLPGLAGLLGGPLPLPRNALAAGPLSAELLSQLRAFQALWLMLGGVALLALWQLRAWQLWLVSSGLLLSALARLAAVQQAGWPASPYDLYLVAELLLGFLIGLGGWVLSRQRPGSV